ncbi:MAG: hypothetical protein JWP28_3430 [Phenylobacterium sp.]|jgi:uncharacterized membrane protein|uniref:hypothetical protein n=1 Tax=Phenylobacterium sp. TaxID=1871053 RepID=UPI0026314228|nr:hypothetical protein [Phenylobacterium sp.]MDB5499399.1 hypothetical protein [Phenylobacterium sp.]
MRRLILFAVLALAACGKSEEPRNPGPAPDVAMNFSQPIDARGTDPSWGLKIRGVQLTLTRPNQPDLVATAPGAVIQPSQASWTAALPDGRAMKVSLFASPCSEGVGDVKYSFSAEVVLPDSSPLTGCAGPPVAPRAAAAKR